MATENTRWLAIGFAAGGCLARSTSLWQPAQPIAAWTDCANPSPSMCNESVPPLASGFSRPAIEWQARHCWSLGDGAADDASDVSANRTAIASTTNVLRLTD